MTLDDENKSLITLIQIFNEYVGKSIHGTVKMSEFYDYVDKIYSIKDLTPYISINKSKTDINIKSIYFDDSRWKDLEFKIFESNDIKIIINEKHKIADFSMFRCNDIDLIFESKSDQIGFIHKNNFSFQECKFKMINIRFPWFDRNQFAFNYKLVFIFCEIAKMDRIENKEFNNNLVFIDSFFGESINFDGKIFNADIFFQNCNFEKEISFKRVMFEKIADFQYSTFKKIDFSNVVFKNNVYFNSAKFNGAFMLEGSQFDKIGNFFKVELNNVFDFTSCLFREPGSINFTVHKVNTNIKMLEYNINKISKEEKTNEKNKNIKGLRIAWAEKLRNSFAVIKHNFLQRNNLIEAQKYKIAEFYAEELRLKYECEIKERCWLESFIAFPKATINFLQLLFYRHTSNHHTDLLKSFNTMLLLIGLFGIFNFGIVMISNFPMNNFIINLSNILQSYKFISYFIKLLINLFIVFVFFLSFLGLLYLKNMTDRLIVFFPFFHKHLSLKNMVKDIKKNIKHRPTICKAFILNFLIFVITSYVCSFLLLVISPKSIISIANLFSGNQHILDPLSALSGIYTILFILLIYSLQKTSRRNSIM